MKSCKDYMAITGKLVTENPWREGIFIRTLTNSSAIADRPRDVRVTSIRKIVKWNFWATLFGGLRGNVDASCVRRWKKRGRLPIGDKRTL